MCDTANCAAEPAVSKLETYHCQLSKCLSNVRWLRPLVSVMTLSARLPSSILRYVTLDANHLPLVRNSVVRFIFRRDLWFMHVAHLIYNYFQTRKNIIDLENNNHIIHALKLVFALLGYCKNVSML